MAVAKQKPPKTWCTNQGKCFPCHDLYIVPIGARSPWESVDHGPAPSRARAKAGASIRSQIICEESDTVFRRFAT